MRLPVSGGTSFSADTPALAVASRERQFAALHRLIGNTPLLAVDVRYRGEARRIFAKHESLSLTGSVKDRMALFVLEDAYRQSRIHPGDRIVEATLSTDLLRREPVRPEYESPHVEILGYSAFSRSCTFCTR